MRLNQVLTPHLAYPNFTKDLQLIFDTHHMQNLPLTLTYIQHMETDMMRVHIAMNREFFLHPIMAQVAYRMMDSVFLNPELDSPSFSVFLASIVALHF